jgi:hypothetical protein
LRIRRSKLDFVNACKRRLQGFYTRRYNLSLTENPT